MHLSGKLQDASGPTAGWPLMTPKLVLDGSVPGLLYTWWLSASIASARIFILAPSYTENFFIAPTFRRSM
jgi:hypothetical protein